MGIQGTVRFAGLAVLALAAAGCLRAAGGEGYAAPAAGFEPAPTRGYLVVSIDTLRADRLGAYGYRRPTSPAFDRLAARGTLFERAIVQYPGTLQSHMSIFTGLYPGEHGVFPPALSLSPQIPTLPELFLAAGFRTAGHTEGGWVKGWFGFARGFEEWADPDVAAEDDIERTFARGLAFLRGLGPQERFFLFLHTYAVHDPYEPPEPFRRHFWPGPPPPGAFPPTGPELARVNERGPRPQAAVVDHLSALYDASVRHADAELGELVEALDASGLLAETTVVITSDHGEEFLEHGHLAHTQPYHEALHVPLLLLHPAQRVPLRVGGLVESVDLAPTLLDLAGIEAPPMSGRSFADALRRPATPLRAEAFAEGESWGGGATRVLYRAAGRELRQLVHTRPRDEGDGFWVGREIRFDTDAARLDFEAVSFARERAVEVQVDGRRLAPLLLGTDWQRFALDLGARGTQRVRLAGGDCRSPQELGRGSDSRCLGFKLRGLAGDRIELFELAADPLGQHDLSRSRPGEMRALLAGLRKIVHLPRAAAGEGQLADEHVKTLKALGYLR